MAMAKPFVIKPRAKSLAKDEISTKGLSEDVTKNYELLSAALKDLQNEKKETPDNFITKSPKVKISFDKAVLSKDKSSTNSISSFSKKQKNEKKIADSMPSSPKEIEEEVFNILSEDKMQFKAKLLSGKSKSTPSSPRDSFSKKDVSKNKNLEDGGEGYWANQKSSSSSFDLPKCFNRKKSQPADNEKSQPKNNQKSEIELFKAQLDTSNAKWQDEIARLHSRIKDLEKEKIENKSKIDASIKIIDELRYALELSLSVLSAQTAKSAENQQSKVQEAEQSIAMVKLLFDTVSYSYKQEHFVVENAEAVSANREESHLGGEGANNT